MNGWREHVRKTKKRATEEGDIPRRSKIVTRIRKLVSLFSLGGSAISMCWLATVSQAQTACIAICISLAFCGIACGGFLISYIEMSKEYGHICFALANSIAVTSGWFSNMMEYSVASMSVDLYPILFLGAAGLQLIGVVPFLFYGECSEQFFEKDDKNHDDDENKNAIAKTILADTMQLRKTKSANSLKNSRGNLKHLKNLNARLLSKASSTSNTQIKISP